MEIKKCENCGSEHIHVITKEIGYSCSKCGRNTVRLNEMYQTNADRIRSMSDEELAEFIEQVSTDSMETISFGTKEYEEIWEHKETALQWLRSEVEE